MKTKKKPSALELHDGWVGVFIDEREWMGWSTMVRQTPMADQSGLRFCERKTRQGHAFACTQKRRDGWPWVVLALGLEGKGREMKRERERVRGVIERRYHDWEDGRQKLKGKEEGKPMVTLQSPTLTHRSINTTLNLVAQRLCLWIRGRKNDKEMVRVGLGGKEQEWPSHLW